MTSQAIAMPRHGSGGKIKENIDFLHKAQNKRAQNEKHQVSIL